MSSTPTRRRWVAASAASAVVATSLSVLGAAAPAHAAPVQIQLLNINDFHGRIDDDTTRFATTVEALRAQNPTGTLVLSAGDNVGASLFASAVADDRPAIDVLNALDVDSTAVGNHEFDRGFEHLTSTIVQAAEFDHLGANVYQKGTSTPALKEYSMHTVNGVDVAVIGVVTDTTPSAVPPDGIAMLDFGNPVDAVNRVAGQLTDGNAANGEADVIVAEYHEGADQGEDSEPPATLEGELAKGGVFADIVNKTSPEVDAIFTAHTHQRYAWTAPVSGGGTRPVVQGSSYGDHVSQVTLTYDTDSGDVTAHTAANVARAEVEDLSHPRVAEVKRITDAALAYAAEVGNRPVTRITGDITTAFSGGEYGPGGYQGGTRDDRQAESTLGALVANALRDGVKAFAEPDLGLTNPGGLRDELLHAGDTRDNPANTDGVVTFAEANNVWPFNNTVAIVELTGADLKAVLEQQWQPEGGSRPFFTLGLSDNVEVTLDESRPAGSRVTSVRIDGEPLDVSRTYTVSTLSFLATGGDNFTALTKGEVLDTGLLDAQLFRDYLASNSPISPDFARQQVHAKGLAEEFVAGQTASFQLGLATDDEVVPTTGTTLDLTSLGSPANTSVVAELVSGASRTELGTYPVDNGIAAVQLTVPVDAPAGSLVELVAQPSGTRVTRPVQAAPGTSLKPRIWPRRIAVDRTRATVRVGVTLSSGERADDGIVTVRRGERVLGRARVHDGVARVRLPRFRKIGWHSLTATYGSGSSAGSTAHFRLRVARAWSRIRPAAFSRDRVKGARFTVAVRAEGRPALGRIKVRLLGNRKWVTFRLRDGRVKVQLQRLTKGRRLWHVGPRRRTVVVRYLGNAKTQQSRQAIRLVVGGR